MNSESPKLTISMIENALKSGNQVGDRVYFGGPDVIVCRNEKEVEMAKKLINNKLTEEEWCSYSKGAEVALQEIWEDQDPKNL